MIFLLFFIKSLKKLINRKNILKYQFYFKYFFRSLVYNSVCIFALIDNVNSIKYNFSGKSYEVRRESVSSFFPNYSDIVKNGIDKDAFNVYLEEKLSDINFIDKCFNNFVS